VTLRALPILLAALATGCSGAGPDGAPSCPASELPQGVVCRFYTAYLELRPSGLPTPEQQAALAPWMSERLERRLDAARQVQALFRASNPGEKPPFVDGCLFASLFEGPTSFEVGDAVHGGDQVRVAVRFRYGTEAHWQDEMVLTREGSAYVIDDIVFTGAGAFNPPGRLSERLEPPGQQAQPAPGEYE
jgi:hypothetical protein